MEKGVCNKIKIILSYLCRDIKNKTPGLSA
jgi:hypothetical protein